MVEDNYAPATGSVRIAYTYIGEDAPAITAARAEAFDRWLTAHDRDNRAIGWDEGSTVGWLDAGRWADGSQYRGDTVNTYRGDNR